jgi:hypothetical protein
MNERSFLFYLKGEICQEEELNIDKANVCHYTLINGERLPPDNLQFGLSNLSISHFI